MAEVDVNNPRNWEFREDISQAEKDWLKGFFQKYPKIDPSFFYLQPGNQAAHTGYNETARELGASFTAARRKLTKDLKKAAGILGRPEPTSRTRADEFRSIPQAMNEIRRNERINNLARHFGISREELENQFHISSLTEEQVDGLLDQLNREYGLNLDGNVGRVQSVAENMAGAAGGAVDTARQAGAKFADAMTRETNATPFTDAQMRPARATAPQPDEVPDFERVDAGREMDEFDLPEDNEPRRQPSIRVGGRTHPAILQQSPQPAEVAPVEQPAVEPVETETAETPAEQPVDTAETNAPVEAEQAAEPVDTAETETPAPAGMGSPEPSITELTQPPQEDEPELVSEEAPEAGEQAQPEESPNEQIDIDDYYGSSISDAWKNLDKGDKMYLLFDHLNTTLKNIADWRPPMYTAYGENLGGRKMGERRSLLQKGAEEAFRKGLDRRNDRLEDASKKAFEWATFDKDLQNEIKKARLSNKETVRLTNALNNLNSEQVIELKKVMNVLDRNQQVKLATELGNITNEQQAALQKALGRINISTFIENIEKMGDVNFIDALIASMNQSPMETARGVTGAVGGAVSRVLPF